MKGLILGLAFALCISAALLVAAPFAHAEKGCADANKDGVVNALDAALILQLVAGLYDPGIYYLHSYDADDNGQIESTDATIVLQYDAGLLTEPPECL